MPEPFRVRKCYLSMHPALKADWERGDSLKAAILAKAAALSPDERRTAPKPSDWSALQTLSHLIIASRFVTGTAKTNGALPRAANPFVMWLLCTVMNAGVALPAPEMMTPAPDANDTPLETFLTEWDAERDAFFALIDAAESPDTLFGVHPFFGATTVLQTVQMSTAHLAYHLKRFPKSGG